MEKVITTDISKYTFKIENFEGPLDLLCHLIDKNKMDIYEININEITDQYIEYLNKMEEMNLEITSEFILMASTLLYIKSKKLLPSMNEEEEEITEEDIINKIIEYKRYKAITNPLKERLDIYHRRIYKPAEKIVLPKQKLEKEYPKEFVPTIYKEIVDRNNIKVNVNSENIKKIATNDNVTVLSKVKEIFKTLLRKSTFVFNKLFDTKKRKK